MSAITIAAGNFLAEYDAAGLDAKRREAAVGRLRVAYANRGKVFGSDDVIRVTTAAMQGLLASGAAKGKGALAPAALAKEAEKFARALLEGLEDGI